MEQEKFNYILCHTVSGDGYSDPTFKLFDSPFRAEKELKSEIKSLEGDGYLLNELIIDKDYSLQTEKEDTNYHRLQIIKEIKADFYLVVFKEPNEVKTWPGNTETNVFNAMADAITRTNWSKTEEKWDGKALIYGAHTDDQDFVHYEIIGPPSELFYIQNRDAGFLGNAPIFWAKNSSGYTSNLNNCHQFTEEEAKKICLGNPNKNKAWPVKYIDCNEGIQRVVDSQYLDYENTVKF